MKPSPPQRNPLAWFGCLMVTLLLALQASAQPAVVEFSAGAFRVDENAGPVVISVRRTGATNLACSADYATSNNTATAGADYSSQSGTLSFFPGETNRTITLAMLDDGLVEGDETVWLSLSVPTGGAVLGLQSNAVLTITDDETPTVLDPTFHPGAGASNDVFALALQPDGKIVIGGQFTAFDNTNRGRIARLNADGSLDLSFNPGAGANGDVYAVAVQGDGQVLLGGAFTTVNGQTSQYLARLNPDGTIDPGFAATNTVNNELRVVALQPDGGILIAGRFTTVGGQSRNRVARLKTDGSLDTTFDPGTGANNSVRSLALEADGRILIGGQFTAVNGTNRNRIARLNANGGLDLSFDPGSGADDQVRAIAVGPSGTLYIGGDFEIYNGTNRSAIARLFADGGLDLDFDQGDPTDDTVRVIVPGADGRVWIGGLFAEAGFAPRHNIARLNGDGSADTSFDLGTGADDEVFAACLYADGRVLIGGKFDHVNGGPSRRIARLNTGPNTPRIRMGSFHYTAAEDAGAVVVSVVRDGEASSAVTVDYATRDGTASAGSDYAPTAGTVAFAPFETEKRLLIPLLNDGLVEGTETFEIVLTNTSSPGILIGPNHALLSILDNDQGFEFVAATFATSENESSVRITVRRQDDAVGEASVGYATVNGTAQAGADYTARSGTLWFAAGETNQTFTIPILADGFLEGQETVLLVLSDPSAGTSLGSQRAALLTIDDYDSTFEFAWTDFAGEPVWSGIACVSRSGPAHQAASVTCSTSDSTARAGWDYVATTQTLTFLPGEHQQWFYVSILNDGWAEDREMVWLTLSKPSSNAMLGPVSAAILFIQDNDRPLDFASTNFVVSENAASVTFTVERRDDGTNTLTVDYATADGTALAGINYLARSGTLTFEPGVTHRTFTVPILDACGVTDERMFTVRLSNLSSGSTFGTNTNALVHIQGNDLPGSRDVSFRVSLEDQWWIHEILVLPDGRVIAAPADVEGYLRLAVRLNEDGSLDPTFNVPYPLSFAEDMVLAAQPDGKVLVYTYWNTGDTGWFHFLGRLLEDGTCDFCSQGGVSCFNGPNLLSYSPIACLLPLQDGTVLLGGGLNLMCSGRNGILAMGRAFVADVEGTVSTMAAQRDNKIIIGGSFLRVNGLELPGLARLMPDGSVDPGFSPAVMGAVNAVAVQLDGRLLASGLLTNVATRERLEIVRLHPGGGLDAGFAPSLNGAVAGFVLQPDGRILIHGNFTSINGINRPGFARLNPSGSLDTDFVAETVVSPPSRVAVQQDGRILVLGGGNGLIRLNGGPLLKLARATRLPNGQFQLSIRTAPAATYVIEGSENLTDWQPLRTNRAADCWMDFIDTRSPASPQTFYRARMVTP